MRTAARKDDNHGQIAQTFEDLGWSVKDVSQLKGFCDLVVGSRGRTYLVEIKDGTKAPSKQKLTPAEQEFHDTWTGGIVIISNREEVINFVNARSAPARGKLRRG